MAIVNTINPWKWHRKKARAPDQSYATMQHVCAQAELLIRTIAHPFQGLGITLFGMAYMFVHDGLVHRRFPVGPIANVPYLRRVAVAHQLHHSDKFKGVPFGLFLGPKELEGKVGGIEELDKEVQRRIKLSNDN